MRREQGERSTAKRSDDVGIPRVLGSYGRHQSGPLVVAVGGLHGNEPSGVMALRKVLTALEENSPPFRGCLLALTGNRAALRVGERFIDADLNRIWNEEDLPEERRVSARGTVEQSERDELLTEIEKILAEAWDRVIFLDLHATSASGAPFVIMADTLQNRHIASHLRIPVILGLEETVSGTVVEYFCERGHVALCIEGGRHDEPETIDHHEASVWLCLVAGGLLAPEAVPGGIATQSERLSRSAEGLPRVVEVLYRHALAPDLPFAMGPGFHNFQPVQPGEILGREGAELATEVTAPANGLLLMPRYQHKGEDGFFLVRPVRRFWLELSRVLRQLGLDRGLRLLPGVRAHPENPRALLVDPRVARLFATQIFHLLGYRKCRPEGNLLSFTRRRDA